MRIKLMVSVEIRGIGGLVFCPLTQELVKPEHEVTVITPDPVFPHGETPCDRKMANTA